MRVSDAIRAQFAKGDELRDAGLTTPDDICRCDNVCYGTASDSQVLDVYYPKGTTGRLPVIVSVHGGAWVYGDKERYQYYCMNLAQRGFTVVNFSYRLAPENQFPAALEDTNLVFHWVLGHAKDYPMDVENLFAVGDSAGAHLLSLYIDICTNSAYAQNYQLKPPQHLQLRAVALNCGQYHMEEPLDELTGKLMEEYLPEKGSRRELQLLCADDYVTEKFPPTFVMTAEDDFLREQAPRMYRQLIAHQVPCELHSYSSTERKQRGADCMDGQSGGFVEKDGCEQEKLGHVFHLNIRSEDACRCNDEECLFFIKRKKKR